MTRRRRLLRKISHPARRAHRASNITRNQAAHGRAQDYLAHRLPSRTLAQVFGQQEVGPKNGKN